ncbi:MAG TPA: VWA domain-containing protein [Candidatus Limnocylindrales bacterium]|nr:VWA domain-containing protein [Candidatus Limnocylindrales bacterium]
MSFIWPPMLLLLLTIPLGALLYAVQERRRRRRVAAYAGMNLSTRDGGTGQARLRRRILAAFTLVGLTLLALALARPQSVVSVPRVEGTVILAFDVSGSMAADDMTPTRMEAAKTAARQFVERQPSSVLVGVVAFSDSGFSIQVPTTDQTLVVAAINRLGPERGTSIARGIQASLTTIAAAEADPAAGFYTNRSAAPTAVPKGTYSSATIVLLSDGENNQTPDPLTAAQSAADRGVRIDTVGVGSAAGATIEVEGFKVHSQLDETMLRQISEITAGTYYAATDPDELRSVYDTINARLAIHPEPMEVTSLFAGAGLLVLVIGGVASLVWLGRLP